MLSRSKYARRKTNKSSPFGALIGMAMTTGIAILGVAPFAPSLQAQNADYNWILTRATGTNGAGSKLEIVIPQTKSPLGRFACVDNQGKGTYSVLTFAANTGALKSGAPAQISVSTPQGKYNFSGLVVNPATGGGIKGITFSVANIHPIWPSLAYGPYVDYQVTGNTGSRLSLVSARGKIGRFANTCGFAPPALSSTTAAAPQVPAQAPVTAPRTPVTAPQTPVTQPRAPAVVVAPVQPQTVQPKEETLPFYQTRPGRRAWRNSNYLSQTGTSPQTIYTANVTNAGLALHAYCVNQKNLQFFITPSGNSYPKFLTRVLQGFSQSPSFQFSFPQSRSYPVQMFLDSQGNIATKQSVDVNSNFIQEFLKGRSLSITNGPFGASFQLKSSKKAICKVVNRCGASSTFCGRNSRATTSGKRQRCRPRSVYIAGRGCILRKYAR